MRRARSRRYRRNDFLAVPERFAGPVTRGVVSHPGFHTASSKETTFAYAQTKVVSETLDVAWRDSHPEEIVVEDYPVVVTLDMAGMIAKVDYDAVEFVRPVLVEVARQVASEPDPIEDLESYVEFGETDRDPVGDMALEWLFQYGSPAVLDPAPSLLDYVQVQTDDPNSFLRALAAGSLPDEALAEITGQFRYTQNVSTDRIVEVWYVQPWWPVILDIMDEDQQDEELAEVLSEAGWSVIDREDVYSHSLDVTEKSVYRRPAPKGARIEYHGTSYRNLLAAAPELELPVPPPPYEEVA